MFWFRIPMHNCSTFKAILIKREHRGSLMEFNIIGNQFIRDVNYPKRALPAQ